MGIKQLVERLTAKGMTMQLHMEKDHLSILLIEKKEDGSTRMRPNHFPVVDILAGKIDVDEKIKNAIDIF